MINKRILVGELGTNCYLAGDKDNLLVIDPGDDAEKILRAIDENNYKVKYIVLTHCHYDHIGAVDAVKERTNAKVLISAEEKENYMSRNVNLRKWFGDDVELLKPDVLLKEGEIIKSGEYEFEVVETPGHTSGGICLLSGNILFSGDTLFYESVGRTDLPTGNMQQLLANIRAKLFKLPPETEVYPGHGEATTIGHEIKNNMFV